MDLHKEQFGSTNIIRTCSVTVEKKFKHTEIKGMRSYLGFVV